MNVQLPMSFLDSTQSPESVRVWPTLEQARKDAVVVMLARLIAKAADARSRPDVDEEARDE
jgi:hypothetical protein